MVNFRDPAVILQDLLAIVKLWHALTGLYIWEFVTTLDFEWNAIRGRRPYRWTMWIYSITRLTTLISAIFFLVNLDSRTKFNCEAIIVYEFVIASVAFSGASLLIVLRNIAIWNGQKLVIVITTITWVANVGFFIQNSVRVRTRWEPLLSTCAIVNLHTTKLNMISTFVTDIALLLIMLIGLLRLGAHERGVYGMGRFMWRQGIVWLLLATIAEIPPVVLITLNLNDALDELFALPTMVTMTIAATRIYRSLMDYSPNGANGGDKFFSTGSTAIFKGRAPANDTTLEPMEVVVHRTFDQSRTTTTCTTSQ